MHYYYNLVYYKQVLDWKLERYIVNCQDKLIPMKYWFLIHRKTRFHYNFFLWCGRLMWVYNNQSRDCCFHWQCQWCKRSEYHELLIARRRLVVYVLRHVDWRYRWDKSFPFLKDSWKMNCLMGEIDSTLIGTLNIKESSICFRQSNRKYSNGEEREREDKLTIIHIQSIRIVLGKFHY